NEESPEQQAVSRAVDNGVLMAISGGNSAMFADGFYYPLASNPDYGLSGSPGIAYDSLQVASFENYKMEVEAVEYTIDGYEGMAAILSAGDSNPSNYVQTSIEAVEDRPSHPEEFKRKDVKGKYALVQLEENPFTEKALKAQAA